MVLAYDRLMNLRLSPKIQAYGASDTILYALGTGLGSEPTAPDHLQFVYEKNLVALPSMAHVLAMDDSWLLDPDSGIDLSKMLHGESGLTIHSPLPAAATVSSTLSVVDIVDRGPGKGALLYFMRDLSDQADGTLLATITGTFFLRGNGGFGGVAKPSPRGVALPDRSADQSLDLATLPQAALLYRLTGDMNPLHADPEVARRGGFDRPILHGSCTYGVACRSMVQLVCAGDSGRLRRLDVRFTAPVYPGETIRTEVWQEDVGLFVFRCTALERGVVILDHGLCDVRTD